MWRILYIEDDDDSAYMLSRRMERHGFQVSHAPDAENGLVKLSHERPHLLMLDLDLPGANGWSVLHRLRNDAAWCSLPVMVVSAHVLDGEERATLDAGANAFMAKPVDFTRLLEEVGRLLGESNACHRPCGGAP